MAQNKDSAPSGHTPNWQPAPKKRRGGLIVLIVVLLVACIGAGVAGGAYLVNTYTQIKDVENAQNIVPKLPTSDQGESSASAAASNAAANDVQEGTIDFDSLRQTNPDIYAWVYIPDTHVNYPVCQSAQDNAYYLTHGASGQESEVGCIFSEAQYNHADMSDRVTVLYGHNGFGSTMFSDLHEYEREEFLNAHDKIYVYTPGTVRTYQVFSAFSAGDRHIMDAFNVQEEAGVGTLIQYLKDPGTLGAHVTDAEVTASDKILVLSTCNAGAVESDGRYLVCGVLVDEQASE